MKTTLGKLRQVLATEARRKPSADTGAWTKEKAMQRGVPFHEKVEAHDGHKTGDWVMVRNHRGGREFAGQIRGFDMVHSPNREPFMVIRVFFGGHTTERRYDLWKQEDYAGPATAADVEQAKADWEASREREARMIDTSREGT